MNARPSPPRHATGLHVAAVIVLAMAALAGHTVNAPPDTGPPDAEQSATQPAPPTPQQVIESLRRTRPPAEPIPPVTPPPRTPPITPAAPGLTLKPLIPEGQFLVDRAGRLVREGQWWTFVFENYGAEVTEAPLRLLPNRLLERMEQFVSDPLASPVFVITVEITEYHGANYGLVRKMQRRLEHGNLGSGG